MATTMWEKSNRRFSTDSHRLSRENLADEHDSDSLDIKPPQAKLQTNYATHRDAGNSAYRRAHYKERESDKLRERERERERLERKRDANWRYERNAKLECREATQHHYQKYHEETIRRQEENYHHYSRQSHGHYYNHMESYARTRHSTEDWKSRTRTHLEEPYELLSDKEERRKRHKLHAHEAELTDEQTEHDLRSRLLSKRNKFMKGHEPAGHDERTESKTHLSEDHHILELKRERLMLRNLLKNTFTNSSEKEEEEERAVKPKRSSTHKSASVLSPSAVAASVTAGLKDLTGLSKSNKKHAKHNSNNDVCSSYIVDSATDNELDLVTDDSDVTNSKHSQGTENSAAEDSAEHNLMNSSSSSKTRKFKKKKKKKKKKRHHTESDVEATTTTITAAENAQPEKTCVVVKVSSDSEQEAVSISTGKSSSVSAHKRKQHLSRGSSIETVSDDDDNDDNESKSACLHSSSSYSRSRSRSQSQSHSRSRSRRRSYSGSISTNSDRSASSHSQERRQKSKSKSKSKSVERLVKTNNSNNNNSEVILEEEDLNLPNYFPGVQGCRSVEEFQCLNRIEEGTYGVVYRAKDKRTNEIVALKRLKMEKEKEGFPITSLREINTLLKGQHPNIVHVREIVVGSNMDKIFIVMDYVEHDLKSLMETMKQRKQNFLPSEVKCLIQQLLRAVAHLHDNWILHRDLKTSNLLLSHKGILKVGDFGLAREYGSPLKRYTLLVVTLWYRAPELLLCAPEYSTPIDMWSVGCIFAELLLMKPLFNGSSEIDQLNRIFKELGTPDEVTWPGFKQLPAYKNILTQNSQLLDYKVCNLKKRLGESVSDLGVELLKGMLHYNPQKRLTAEAALRSDYFTELPLPIDPSMFPTWPAKSELGARKTAPSPKPPSGGGSRFQTARDVTAVNSAANAKVIATGNARILSSIITGNKKSGVNTGFVLNAGLEQRRLDLLRSLNKK